ncbi:MAG: SoxR reducing system RseC family protein [Butyricicoccaceae bacterium]
MQQEGIVIKTMPGNLAEIKVKRKSACGHDCEKCGAGCAEMISAPLTAIAKNPLGAKLGDAVTFEGSSKQVLGLAMLVYVIPLVLFFVFYAVAALIGAPYPSVIACVGFVVGIVLAKLYNDHKADASATYTIIHILS